ncbi:MAG: hypothetical protein PF541_07775, partial [Prolixibacteraceae bacterium]|nr:hypothetical protein [Prolixibacteraceae bacterium]
MQQAKDHTLNNNQYELLFEDINFVGGLLALTALKSGVKVALSFTRNLNTIYQPELSNYYPQSLTQTPAAVKDFQFLMKCSSLFPHLFFPQRVLYLLNNTKLNSGFTLGVDKLLGRDRESSTLPIRTEKYTEYNAFSSNYKQANLLYEYLFDQNQATFELLAKCVAEGAQVVSTPTNVEAKVKLKCVDVNSSTVFIPFNKSTLTYKNPIRISTLNFDLVLLTLQNKSVFQLHLNNTKLAGNDFQKAVSAELDKLGISTSIEMQSYLNEYHAKMNSEPEKCKNSIADIGLSNLRSTFDSYLKSTSVLLGKKLKIEVVFSKHTNA